MSSNRFVADKERLLYSGYNVGCVHLCAAKSGFWMANKEKRVHSNCSKSANEERKMY
jgi:hypothetical protein